MARLMRYMLNYQGRKLFANMSIKLSKPVLFSLSPPVLEKRQEDGVSWQCGLDILNTEAYPEGTVFHYTIDGSEPTRESAVFTENTIIDRNCTVRMIGVWEGEKSVRMTAVDGAIEIADLRNAVPAFWMKPNPDPFIEPEIVRTDGERISECHISVGNADSYPQDIVFVYTIDGSEPQKGGLELPATIYRNGTLKVKGFTEDNHSRTAEMEISDLRNELPAFVIGKVGRISISPID